MVSNEKILLINKYANEILEVIDNQDDYTRSDLQGRVDAIVMNILNEKK
jgi:hypothetical protein